MIWLDKAVSESSKWSEIGPRAGKLAKKKIDCAIGP